MADGNNKLTFWGFFKIIIKGIIGLALFLQAILFIFIMVAVLAFMGGIASQISSDGSESPSVRVPQGAALVVNPAGVLVEQAASVDPFEEALAEAYGASAPPQIEVGEVIRAIRTAKDDDRIQAMVLDLGSLYVPSYAASKLHAVAEEIEAFRESGKQVIAVGDYYSQEQYFLASHADHIMMHDQGNLFIYGYGSYNLYLKSLYEKLKVTSHEFRVGTYKSALEPYTRDDMSPEAKQANQAYIDVLWSEYAAGIEASRGLSPGSIFSYANDMESIVAAAGGDLAMAAVNAGLIDELKTRDQQEQYITDIVGEAQSGDGFKGVGLRTYLTATAKPARTNNPDIAVVTAAGTIVDGEQPVGLAGGDTIAGYLKQAREDDDVKAVVLRVDSPGGSLFASEIMRQEVLALKEAGKPVVVSMGSLAASGGYWISADADEIWASPTTITGSIGVFGFVQTYEETAATVGAFTDGVGTTDLSGMIAAGIGPLPEDFKAVWQGSVENAYDDFLTVVSDGRDMTKAAIDEIAQGRVWIGEDALRLGLVDQLGDLDDAIASAATMAELDAYDIVEMEQSKSRFDMFLERLSSEASGILPGQANRETVLFGSTDSPLNQPALKQILSRVNEEVRYYEAFNDPNSIYVRCLECELE